MDESTQDPTFAPEVTSDNPALDDSAPVEQGQGAEQEVDFAEKFDPSSLDETLQEQYRSMRGDYTRKTQSLAEERKAFEAEREQYTQALQIFEALQEDPETTLAQLQELLLEGADTGEYDEYEDGDDNPMVSELQQRLDRLEAEKQAERQQQADVAALAADVEQINKLRGEQDQLTADELQILGQFAQRDQNGNLRLLDAYQALDQWFTQRQQKYVAGKRAPSPPGSGSAGSEKFDITDRDSRVKRLQSILDGGR